ncbi:MAG: GntR family transcriptional regulator [Lentisphaerae bacterium]|nr:GntR family transcriptional regulator [Lentisphaerota bacterium]
MIAELSNLKKYEVIADRIESMIIDSRMKPGSRILSVRKLIRHFKAAPATICNALDLLRERGIIVSIPQKGFFVHKLPADKPTLKTKLQGNDIAEYLESALPLEPFFLPSRKVISFNLREYASTPRKTMWDDIIRAFRKQHSRIEIEVHSDMDESSPCDLVLYSDNQLLNEMPDIPEIRTILEDGRKPEDYFPIARASLEGNQRPASPFAISQAWRIFNRHLMETHCPGLNEEDYQHLISTVRKRFDFQSADFPPMGTFVQFFLLNMMEEGLLKSVSQKPSFDTAGVRQTLEFNRSMLDKVRKNRQDVQDVCIFRLWDDLVNDRLMSLDSFSYVLRILPKSRIDDFIVRPSPASGNGSAVTRVQMLGVRPDSINAGEAAEFIRFACGPEGQHILAESRCNIPALRSSAESDAFLSNVPAGVGMGLLQHLYQPRSLLNELPFSSNFYYAALNRVLSEFYFRKIDTETALRRMNRIRLHKPHTS